MEHTFNAKYKIGEEVRILAEKPLIHSYNQLSYLVIQDITPELFLKSLFYSEKKITAINFTLTEHGRSVEYVLDGKITHAESVVDKNINLLTDDEKILVVRQGLAKFKYLKMADGLHSNDGISGAMEKTKKELQDILKPFQNDFNVKYFAMVLPIIKTLLCKVIEECFVGKYTRRYARRDLYDMQLHNDILERTSGVVESILGKYIAPIHTGLIAVQCNLITPEYFMECVQCFVKNI